MSTPGATMTPTAPPVADWIEISELYRDPYPIFARLRAEGGVHWVPSVDRYLITSYDAVHETELDQVTFSANEAGSLQIRAMGHSMLRKDDPDHRPERLAWQPVLRPAMVKKTWTAVFERNARRYLAELVEKGPGSDLVKDFAAGYAAENLREILGLHNVEQLDLQRWSQTLINATGNYANDPEVWREGERSFREVGEAVDEMLAWHRTHEDGSLLSALVRVPDYQMPIESIHANIRMTIGGGLNEPRDAIGNAVWALLSNPDQLALVQADPSLWPIVFEESLRWIAPIGMYSRQTTREVQLAGVTLPAGARLGICVLSANRDEGVWENAERFDIRREVKPHLAFSKGVHVCLGAWVARAEVATVALPLLFDSLHGLALHPDRPAIPAGWVFPGMTALPVVWDAASPVTPAPAASATGGSVAVVGSGPAGCFTAQALRRIAPDARIDVFDAMPTPYGLIRYGVAADHQGTKAVTAQFDRMFTQGGVRFFGGIRVGTDVPLETLREQYDAVVLATGLRGDRKLGVPGDQLPGVVGAGVITRALNTAPDAPAPAPLGRDVAVVGLGNVAVDVVRLLAKDAADFTGSDVDDAARERLCCDIRTIQVIGRSQPGHARFDPVMVRELAELRGVAHVLHGLDESAGDPARVAAVLGLPRPAEASRVVVHWWFERVAERIEGTRRAEAIVVRNTATNATERLAVDSVVTAIGFQAAAGDELVAVPEAARGNGRVEPGLYLAGWARRGARGTIPEQRADAAQLAALIATELPRTHPADDGPRPSLADTVPAIGFQGWRRIDRAEREAAAPGRVRAKLATLAALRHAAESGADEVDEAAARRGAATEVPVTILYGSESGNSELIAEDLAAYLGGGAEVRVLSLADAEPSELDPERLHLVICSTYGDGELPTAVRPFATRLAAERPDLGGIRHAIFGLGDRSYSATYSRGGELIDEALTAAGSQRVGPFGRHDASSTIAASDAALEWIEAVLAEVQAPVPAH